MKYPRIFATADGESHFEDLSVPLEATQLVPGRPAVEVGPAIATSAATFLHLGANWAATWHPTPKHWFCVTLAGEIEPFEFGAIYIWRLADGKVAELWQEADRVRLMQQLDVLAR
jgi:hypothetical protein